MKKLKIFFIFFVFLCMLCLLFTKGKQIYAQDQNYKTYDNLGFDKNLSDDSKDSYQKVEKIVLCSINKSDRYRWEESKDWYASLYYYLITELHFYDIPFNFIVDEDNIYQSRKSNAFVSLQPFVKNSNTGISLIGVVDLYNNMNPALIKLVEYLGDIYDLQPEDVKITQCLYRSEKTNDTFTSFLALGSEEKNLVDFVDINIPNEYITQYDLKVLDVNYEHEVSPDSLLEIKVKVKNTGTSPWYQNSSIALYTNNQFKHESSFFVSGKWVGRSVIGYVDKTVTPGSEYTFIFQLKPNVFPSEYKESFIFGDLNSNIIEGTNFDITFNTKNIGYQFVKVNPNEYGFLNVRDKPSSDATIITRVSPNDVYIALEINEQWVKIKIDEERSGWVARRYVTPL